MHEKRVNYGKGVRLVSERKIQLTQGKAEEHLGLEEIPGERPLRSRHVAFLEQQWRDGNFRPELAPLALAWIKGEKSKRFRVNGQHTCWARLHLPKAERWNEEFTLYSYECDDLDAVRRLYASFDRGATRTSAHVVRANIAGTAGYEGVSNKIIQSIKGGLSLWLWGSVGDCAEARRHSPDEIAELMKGEHHDLCAAVAQFLRAAGKDGRHVCRAGVVAAVLATWDKAPRIAEHQFWPPVVTGFISESQDKGHGASDPRLRLHRELLQVQTHTKTLRVDSQMKIVPNEAIYRGCVRTWRSFRRDQKLKGVRWMVQGERPSVV